MFFVGLFLSKFLFIFNIFQNIFGISLGFPLILIHQKYGFLYFLINVEILKLVNKFVISNFLFINKIPHYLWFII